VRAQNSVKEGTVFPIRRFPLSAVADTISAVSKSNRNVKSGGAAVGDSAILAKTSARPTARGNSESNDARKVI
jgi:hypothetical protein